MLEFKKFKVEDKDNLKRVMLNFTDDELSQETLEEMSPKFNEYEIYLEYDYKGEFILKYKKKALIEIILTLPARKVPENKKELEEFINRHVMDFSEYYKKINALKNHKEL